MYERRVAIKMEASDFCFLFPHFFYCLYRHLLVCLRNIIETDLFALFSWNRSLFNLSNCIRLFQLEAHKQQKNLHKHYFCCFNSVKISFSHLSISFLWMPFSRILSNLTLLKCASISCFISLAWFFLLSKCLAVGLQIFFFCFLFGLHFLKHFLTHHCNTRYMLKRAAQKNPITLNGGAITFARSKNSIRMLVLMYLQ